MGLNTLRANLVLPFVLVLIAFPGLNLPEPSGPCFAIFRLPRKLEFLLWTPAACQGVLLPAASRFHISSCGSVPLIWGAMPLGPFEPPVTSCWKGFLSFTIARHHGGFRASGPDFCSVVLWVSVFSRSLPLSALPCTVTLYFLMGDGNCNWNKTVFVFWFYIQFYRFIIQDN